MLGKLAKGCGDRLLSGAAARLARVGVGPAWANVCEVLAAVGCGLCFAAQERVVGLALLVLHGAFDYLDGALQRAGARPRRDARRAARLHAWVDKAAEAAIFLGLGLGAYASWAPVVGALATSLAATVTGFRVAAQGVERKHSPLDRADRVAVLLLAVASGAVVPGLMAIVALNLFIVAHRLVSVWRR